MFTTQLGNMEGSEGEMVKLESCVHEEEMLQCNDQLIKTDIEQSYIEYTSNNLEPDKGTLMTNGVGEHFIERQHEQAENRPMRDILPIFFHVWTQLSHELQQAYKLYKDLINEKNKLIIEPFLDAVDSTEIGLEDYYDRIKDPMDLFKISEKFNNLEYVSITEVVADVRQMIENCYRYNGVDAFVSKQAFKLEVILEQKLALLSRELRSKSTIAATNVSKSKEYLNDLLFTSGGRRMSKKPSNGESSLIAMQIGLQDFSEEKERKRQKEREKKEIYSALEEELEKWKENVLTASFLSEITTTWEVPSVGIFVYVLKDFLNLQELNYTEFELGTLFPEKSALIAKIFTSLLVTPFQRSKLNHKEPMKYSVWEAKVNTRITSWYKMAISRGEEYTASLFGFDADLFHVLGPTNPFDHSKYHLLPLRSRMWILKALCEAALEQDSALRDHFGDLDFLDRQDLCLGSDGDGFSYHYFTQFGATDIRIYKQKEMGEPSIRKVREQVMATVKPEPVVTIEKKIPDPVIVKDAFEIEEEKASTRTSNRIKIKKNLSPPPVKSTPTRKERKPKKEIGIEFQLVVSDIPSLNSLINKIAEQLKAKGHRRTPEKELYQTLEALLEELTSRESNLLKASQKAKLKVMLEWKQADEDSKMQNGDISKAAILPATHPKERMK